MSYIFDVSKRKRLNSEERQKLLTPRETLTRLGYKEGMSFADIGCGTGLFTFSAAALGGDGAQIFAVDISPEMLADVIVQIAEKGVTNIETVLSEPYDFKLADNCADFILVCTVLHEIADKVRFLKEARRVTKNGGTIAVIDFSETDAGFGPSLDHRLARGEVQRLLESAGFDNVSVCDLNEVFYAVTAS